MTIEEISKYIFLDVKNSHGDIAIVFGTWNTWKESIEKAADLYKNGFVPKIIVSGGLNPNTGIIEGDRMAKDLEGLGVPNKDILIENRATNTKENALYAIEIIDHQIGLKNIQSIVAIVKGYHARRALMTLRKYVPTNIMLKAASYTCAQYPFTKDNWYKTEDGRKMILNEVEKIKMYLTQGDIAKL
jgi:uncharacterized SAM-binding protein YcdF (DUF218 family)